MRLFGPLYDKCMMWAADRRAPAYLAGLSFAESSFFPIPPDVMLAPMSLARPAKAWRFAFITTITSVLGGLLGYLIGYFAFDFIEPWLSKWGYLGKFDTVKAWFDEWGFVAIFIAGFSPIPYKVFTISAGLLHMALLPFILASIIGRGARFYLVAGLMRWGGARMEQALRRYVEWLGWLVVILAVVVYFIVRYE